MVRRTAWLAGWSLCLTAGVAQAAVVDFEDIAVAVGANSVGGDRVSGGMNFDLSTDHSHLTHDTGAWPANGTTHLSIDDNLGTNTLTVSPVGGGAFSLLQADLAEGDPTNFATSLSITGSLAGGGTVNTAFSFDGVHDEGGPLADFETYVFGPGWDNLTSVSFVSTAGNGVRYWSLDNLSYGPPVPEPGSLALVALGGLALLRRRRRL